ncbi:MAG: exodeoxyribonuclease VII small subunit [Clostridiales bacterium]|nr:exodeoxyribonuclease VII small subunit [Clostridiales bacterium]
MSFESDMKRLEEISVEMAKEDIVLEHSLELYKEAVPLIKKCKDYIENAKITVEKLGEENG